VTLHGQENWGLVASSGNICSDGLWLLGTEIYNTCRFAVNIFIDQVWCNVMFAHEMSVCPTDACHLHVSLNVWCVQSVL